MEVSRLRTGRCGVCQQSLEGAALTVCVSCSAAYHPDCWDYNGRRCATFGCVKDPFPKRPLPPPQRHADVFNPVVLAGFAIVIGVMLWYAWHQFSRL